MTKCKMFVYFTFLLVFSVIVSAFAITSVKAGQDSSGFPSITVESYTYNGQTTYCGGESNINVPAGATIDFRVWVDLYNNDPVKIAYADGSSDTYNFGGAFSHDFYHTYNTAGGYVAEAYMPTDSGTFTGFSSTAIMVGSANSNPNSGSDGNQGSNNNQGTGGSNGEPINSVYAFFETIGQAFGLTGDTAVVVGVVAACLIFTPFVYAVAHSIHVHNARKYGNAPRTGKKIPPSYKQPIPPSYQQPQNPPGNSEPAGYPIYPGQGQVITGAGITGTTVPPPLPTINLRADWTLINPGAGSLDAVRQVMLNWDLSQYDTSQYTLKGYEVWKLYGQTPIATLGPDAHSWPGTFRGDIPGLTLRAVFQMPTNDIRFVFATTSPPL